MAILQEFRSYDVRNLRKKNSLKINGHVLEVLVDI